MTCICMDGVRSTSMDTGLVWTKRGVQRYQLAEAGLVEYVY